MKTIWVLLYTAFMAGFILAVELMLIALKVFDNLNINENCMHEYVDSLK